MQYETRSKTRLDLVRWRRTGRLSCSPFSERCCGGRHRGKRYQTNARSIRFLVATLTALSTAVALTVAVLTPPKGGPFCVENCIGYPYTDFDAHIPRDFLWMYPALFVAAAV